MVTPYADLVVMQHHNNFEVVPSNFKYLKRVYSSQQVLYLTTFFNLNFIIKRITSSNSETQKNRKLAEISTNLILKNY